MLRTYSSEYTRKNEPSCIQSYVLQRVQNLHSGYKRINNFAGELFMWKCYLFLYIEHKFTGYLQLRLVKALTQKSENVRTQFLL